MSNAAPTCAHCGAPLKQSGACPRCMLEAGLAGLTRDEEDRPMSPTLSTTLGGRVPARFGDYELVEEIAHGGMGVVYLARQVSLERFVALKFLLRGKHTAEDLKERFRREARAAAGLRHPNIVVVHEVGIVEDQPFFSMDFIEGRSLSETLREGPLSPAKAAEYCRTIAEAIEYAHGRWVLHRDLKPSNVLIDLNDEPHVTDFGLAGKMEVRSDLTLTGQMLGSPGYLSPEQASGRMHEVTAASDIYSIGAILYECLTGRPPFLGESLQDTLLRIRDEEPVSPMLLNPVLPKDLETICLKCLEKDPARRYATAGALADDLGRWLRHEPIHAKPANVLCHATKWVRRNPKLSGVALMITAALLGFSIFAGISNQRLREAGQRIHEQAAENRQRLARSQIQTGNRLVVEGDLATAMLWFTEAWRSDPPRNSAREEVHLSRLQATLALAPSLKHLWIGEKSSRANAGPRVVHHAGINDVAFSPDGKWLAFASDNGEVHVKQVKDGNAAYPPLKHATWVQHLKFSPAGDQIATQSADGRARVWAVDTGKPLCPWLEPPVKRPVDEELTLEWHPDGTRLLVAAAGQPAARLWALPEGRLIKEYQLTQAVVWAAFAEDGTQVMTAHEDRRVYFWDAGTGQLLERTLEVKETPYRRFQSADQRWLALINNHGRHFSLHDLKNDLVVVTRQSNHEMYQTVEFSPDGKRHVLGKLFRDSLLCDSQTGAIILGSMDHDYGVSDAAFAPAGHFFATAGLNGQTRLWSTQEGEPPLGILNDSSALTTVAFSHDGKHLCTANVQGVVRLWALDAEANVRRELESQPVVKACLHPEGDLLAYATANRELKMLQLKTGEPLFVQSSLPATITDLVCSPDGRWLAVWLQNGRIRVLDATSGIEVQPELEVRGRVSEIAWSPDSRFLAAAVQGPEIPVWEIPGGTAPRLLKTEDGGGSSLSFSPDGRWLATGGRDQKLRLFDSTTWEIQRVLETTDAMASLRFSPDSSRILTQPPRNSANFHVCQVWDAQSGKPITQPLKHQDGIEVCTFSPDGKYIATGGRDNVARLWHAQSGSAACPPLRHEMQLRCLAFNPASTVLATGSNDSTARLWDCASGEPVSPPLQTGGYVQQVIFSKDGSSLFTMGGGGLIEWCLQPTAPPLSQEGFRSLAQVMTGVTLSGDGELLSLERETLLNRWEQVRPKSPTDPLPSR